LHGLSTIARVILHYYHPQVYKDNSNFMKEKLTSFVEAACPHKESSLMGAKG
jgi:hypothetical protein